MFDKSDYIIEISKLVKGSNEFDIEVDKTLFDNFECEDVLDVKAKIHINAIKNERFIEINFAFNGEIKVECSRCLSEMAVKINKKTSLYVKFGEKFEEVDINEWIVDINDNNLDLTNYIYEELRVEIPIAPVHKHKEDCNKEMLEKLSSINEENNRKKENEIDPRWAKLAELKNN